VVFQKSPRELFSGEYQKVERMVCRRAKRLAARFSGERDDRTTRPKQTFLEALSSSARKHP